ncbi:MAG: NUDIX domain-containing protein [Rikenellaceae bacterium]
MEKCQFLDSFHFCPKCGAHFEDNNIKSKRCVACGFTYYFNPSAAVAAFILNDKGELLVSTRAHEPAKGSLDLPGGFVDSFESGEQSVRREVLEECHISLESVSYLFSLPNIYNYSNFDVHTLDMFFECKAVDFAPLRADDDVATLQFIALDKLDVNMFGLNSIRAAVERYISLRVTL